MDSIDHPPHGHEHRHGHGHGEGHGHRQIPLYSAGSGARVQVVTVPDRMTAQLARQGVRLGDVLTVRNRAPMGGAILVEAQGATIALSHALARHVMVKVLT